MVNSVKKVRVVGDRLDASHGLLTACLYAALAACFPAHTLHAVHRIVTSHTKHHMLYSTFLILGKLHEASWRQPRGRRERERERERGKLEATSRPCPHLL